MAGINGDPVPHSDVDLTGEVEVEDEEINDHPIEQVRLTVPITDDQSLPALTFRTWVLGILSCCLLAFLNQFFGFRQNPIGITSTPAQILAMPLGQLMAKTLPTKSMTVPFTKWSFSLNPGPFNIKEHVLITIFANCGSGGVYAVGIITIVLAFYHAKLNIFAALLLSNTTQMLGYGWAGLFRKILVDSPYMWWPGNLVQVSLFRALHEKEKRPKGGHTRLQFFLMVGAVSFFYYILPAFFFPSLAAISVLCLIWKDSITAQQLGSGLHGLGIGSIGLDWSAVGGFLGSPLAAPGFTIINTLTGFFFFAYLVGPLFYYNNVYQARRFPFMSEKVFDSEGQIYNISRVLNKKTFELDIKGYESYSKLYLSTFFTFTYGLSFATLAASLSHVGLFHGKEILSFWKKTTQTLQKDGDVHTRIMKKNYKTVPNWWFHAILILVLALSMFNIEGFGKQLQLPWWGLLLACFMAFVFTLPIGVINATTNQAPGLNVITEMIFGYLYPGRPLANVVFKTYGTTSQSQAIMFVSDFKLGHYMKIPPRDMFWVQLAGTVVASTSYFMTAWWLLTSVENICEADKLPEGSPWTCPNDSVFYNASIIWGVLGPGLMFTTKGIYPELNWFFLIGALSPVPIWFLSKKFPNIKWLPLINMPVFLAATGAMPPARSVNYLMWGAVGLFFNVYVYRKYKAWWARHTYILSAAMDAGVAFLGVLLYFTLQSKEINGPEWWGLSTGDHCPLVSCPTAPGIKAKGCPVH